MGLQVIPDLPYYGTILAMPANFRADLSVRFEKMPDTGKQK
jgi:hypothetical protein